MRKLFRALKKLIIIILSEAPKNFLELLERLFQEANGKGFGTSSIHLEVKLFAKALNSKNIVQPILLDLGGNIGLWSLEFKKFYPDSEIHILEPSSVAFEKLSLNTANITNVSIYNQAVDVHSGSRLLHSDKPGSGLGSFYERNLDHFGINRLETESVSCIEINEFLLDQEIKPNYLKIDIEGHELSILKSINDFGSNFQVILFEFGRCNIDSRTFFQDFWYFFKEKKFKIYRITPSGLTEIKKYNESLECFRTTNYIAISQN